ncbi:MAG: hypothetical protein WDW36_000555 [Sanguina aurantia]
MRSHAPTLNPICFRSPSRRERVWLHRYPWVSATDRISPITARQVTGRWVLARRSASSFGCSTSWELGA